jgi:radical SAM superfamily enzyme YgiQ (UPF0313 family)
MGYLLKALSRVEGVRPVHIDCQLQRLNADALLKRLQELQPRMVGFQVFSIDYHRFREILPRLRTTLPNTVIIAGGPHVSGLPEDTLLSNPDLDYVVKGEGEEALARIARHLVDGTLEANLSTIPNLVYRTDGGCTSNPTRWIDVDDWGSPAWELIHPDRYPPFQHGGSHKGRRVAPVLTSRGCPYPCTYCAGHLLTGKKIRLRNIQSVVDELELLNSEYGIDEFLIEDENFSFHREHALAFIDEVRRRRLKYFFSFPNGLRMDKLDEEIIRGLREIGTYKVNVGLESGSEEVLKRVKKKWDFDQCEDTIKSLRRHGIEVRGFFILGFPEETREDMRKTVRLALRCGVDTAYFQNFLPLPGTEAFTTLCAKGELSPENIDWAIFSSNVGQYPYSPEGISATELSHIIRMAYLRFYLRPRQILLVLGYMSSLTFLKGLLFNAAALFNPFKAARKAASK